eukprot:698127-Prymnesium_polylepis.2
MRVKRCGAPCLRLQPLALAQRETVGRGEAGRLDALHGQRRLEPKRALLARIGARRTDRLACGEEGGGAEGHWWLGGCFGAEHR